jgi:LmbE family N-acetylglucosaminyl deacetylase
MTTRTLLAVLAHPDDESLGFGGTLAKYAAEGVRVHLVTATRGDRGRYRGKPPGDPAHPGQAALAGIREVELRDAARALGIHDVSILGYPDGGVDRVDAREAVAAVAQHIRRIRPQVVVTFGPDGAYGHPDHVAVSQFATAAVVAAAHPASQMGGAALGADAHVVSKFYYLAWPAETWDAYHAAIGVLRATVDGVERQAVPWPDWMITTVVDTRNWWSTTWQAVSCHQSQVSAYERLRDVSAAHHEALWGRQSYYRVFSTVNGGRGREADLFDGLSC